jgi:cytoskeleton protein RodZ
MSLFSKPKDVVDRALAGSEAGTPRPAAEAAGARRRTIGQLLRETRERQGSEISRVATALRIKAAHIEAIEEGQYDRLPGAVYALGFVRAYATHLGLDGEEAVRRFKLEAEGFDDQRDLAFPVPLAERSIPGGVMMLTALLFAICAYGVWYYLSAATLPRLDRVSAVPSELLPHPPAASTPAAPPSSDDSTAPAPAAAPSTPSAANTPPAAPAPAPLPSAAVTTEVLAPPPAAAIPPPRATAEARPQPASPAPVAAPPRAVAVAEAPAAADASANPASPPMASAVPDVPPAVPPAPPEPPKTYGLSNGNARVIIRATADSWIQVRSADQTPIFTRELHAGDTYHVPDQPGVNMRTGKASVLAITVDGRAAPPIRGGVRLNVILDPERLLAGNAAE